MKPFIYNGYHDFKRKKPKKIQFLIYNYMKYCNFSLFLSYYIVESKDKYTKKSKLF